MGPVQGRLKGKVVMITGAGSGQGRDAAMLFARAGATVVGSDVDAAAVEETRLIADQQDLRFEITRVDAASEAEVAAWTKEAVKRHGGLDVLYNNAATTHFAPIGEMTLKQWRDTLRFELDVVFIPTRAAWAHLVARGAGSIINIASVCGMRATEPAGAAAHAAGKSGVLGFTRQLALEGAPHGIRANSLSPGFIVTPMTDAMLNQAGEALRKLTDGYPMLGRAGRPIDVAYAGLFFASDESAWITGANLVVDGGWSAKSGSTSH